MKRSFKDLLNSDQIIQSGFEIIAIELGEKQLPSKLIKTLRQKELYYLNKNYKILNDKIEYVKHPKIYNIDNLDINIHAIVGKNGTGKSTIIELLFLAINNISYYSHTGLNVIKEEIGDLNLYYRIDNKIYKISFYNNTYLIFNLQDKTFVKEQERDLKELNIEDNFFYTIGINYSQHSLNAIHFGEWLNKLFHKNDSYQTPIVIEPFRDNGNIQINNQDELIKSRLLTNILKPINNDFNFRKLTEYFEATDLEFKINTEKVKFVYENIGFNFYKKIAIENHVDLLLDFFGKKLEKNLNLEELSIEKNIAALYIFKKIIKITKTYKQYSKYSYLDTKENVYKINDFQDFLYDLKKDQSHITYKLRQAINFLYYNLYDYKRNYTIENLSIEISKIIEKNGEEKIDFLIPPAFLNTSIIFSKEEKVYFNSLSSGEKQKIYSINSIIYHLSNLNSVIESFDKNLLKYRNINIVLDEIELYFHPELQRTYINHLLSVIELMKKQDQIENIDSLNFIFVTHSPFILSDLIQENVLFLDKEEVDKKTSIKIGTKTFGANIHDLLIEGFFIKDSIGKFTQKKIKDIIEFFNKEINNTSKTIEEYKIVREKFLFILDAIGESYIKGILNSYIKELDEKFNYSNEEIDFTYILNEIKTPEEKAKVTQFIKEMKNINDSN